jgi:ABC-type nitrate/sulfonate/bicarbonate transport system substrate-binding protein
LNAAQDLGNQRWQRSSAHAPCVAVVVLQMEISAPVMTIPWGQAYRRQTQSWVGAGWLVGTGIARKLGLSTSTRMHWEINMVRPFTVAAERALPRTSRRNFLAGGLSLAALAAGEAHAQAKLEQTDVAIVATRDTQVGVQLAIADALGYFKDEGLQVSPKWVQSGDDVVQLLGSGAVPMGCASTFGATLLAAQRIPIRAVQGVADMAGTQGFVLGPKVKLASPKELEGKKLAYTNGNPQILILAKLAKLHGFDMSKVSLVNMLPSEGVVAAEKGDVAGLLSFQPFLYRLVTLGGTMYVTGRQSWIKDKPNTVKAVMRAFDRATKFLASDRPQSIEIIQKGIRIDPAAIAAIMNVNVYNSALTQDMASSISDLSDWALSIKRIPIAVKPTDIIDPTLLASVNPSLVTYRAP